MLPTSVWTSFRCFSFQQINLFYVKNRAILCEKYQQRQSAKRDILYKSADVGNNLPWTSIEGPVIAKIDNFK